MRKPQFSEQLLERFPELMGTDMKDFHVPCVLGVLFQELGWSPRARHDHMCIVLLFLMSKSSEDHDHVRSKFKTFRGATEPSKPDLPHLDPTLSPRT